MSFRIVSQVVKHSVSARIKEMRAIIVEAYNRGASGDEVAARFGISFATVRKSVRATGHSMRPAVRRRVYSHNSAAFSESSPEVHYWVGFMMADGCVRNPNVTKLGLAIRDIAHVEKFKTFLRSEHPIRHTHRGRAAYFTICCKNLVADLARHGVIPRKTMVAQAHLLQDDRDFWRGVMDGDGCITTQNGYPRVILIGSLPLITQYKKFVLRHTCTVAEVLKVGNIWKFTISGTAARVMMHILYDDCVVALDRKYEKVKQILTSDQSRSI